jgi:hypothetical protein
MSFSLDISKWAEKAGLSMDEAARGIKIELFNSVIRDTRVDTGRLRGNWQTSVGMPETGTTDRINKIQQGTDGGSAQAEVKRTVRSDTVDYLTNNLPYAEVWEEKDAMIGRNVARIRQIVKKAVK